MKILLTHRFFWPDTAPYATMLRTLGDYLCEKGHEVHIFSSAASYRSTSKQRAARETLGKLKVFRVWVFTGEKAHLLKKLANTLIYSISLFYIIVRQRPDVVTASTFPPVIAGWSASLAAKLCQARFVYHIQDIHPEVSIYSGGLLGRAVPSRILTILDNQTLRRASMIVTLSNDMAATLRSRGLGSLPITVVNNPPLEDDGETIAPPIELIKAEGTIRVIFAGNLGRFQNLPNMAEGVAKCFDSFPNLELLFLGDGAALPELKRRWGDHPQVRFHPFLPYMQAKEIIAASDIGVVSLIPNLYKAAFPSKLSTYLALGVKILALVEPKSELAVELVATGNGTVPMQNTPAGIALALQELIHKLDLSSSKVKERSATNSVVSSNGWGRKMIEVVEGEVHGG